MSIPESARLEATDKSIARIKITIIWLKARIIRIEVSVKTSDMLLGVTKRGLANPTPINPIKIIENRIKSLLIKIFFMTHH